MSTQLLAIQRALQAHLLDPEINLDAVVAESPQVSSAIRLHIYANAYRVRFVEALTADYGMLRRYLGDDAFEALVQAYIAEQPSRYVSLRDVGAGMEDFLRRTEPYAAHIELIELARFEWALCHAFDAADCEPATLALFANLDAELWPALTVCFAPALRCIELRSNAPLLWQSLNADGALPALTVAGPELWLVWRRQLRLMFRRALPQERVALEAFRRGAAFAEVCAALVDELPESAVPTRAVALLQQWLQDELIVA